MLHTVLIAAGGFGLCVAMACLADRFAADFFRTHEVNDLLAAPASRPE